MNIGICTQKLATNYGGILQNYALQTILKRMGHNVWTFDIGNYTWFDYFNINIRILVHKILGRRIPFYMTPIQRKQLETPLRRFVYSHISLTKPRTKWFKSSLIRRYNLDCLISGSDQVWRPRYNAHVEDLYFRFAQNYKLRKIAYAASFGTDEWEYSEEQQSVCASLAQKFDAISVRERSGIKLSQDYLGVTAEWVLDPTMLLQKEDYMSLCDNVPHREPYIFAYILDENEELLNEIIRLSSLKKLPYIIKRADDQIHDTDSIELWLSFFRDADFVVTDSFHGTVFSVLLCKDFAVFKNIERGSARFDSLLSMFGLEERVIGGKVNPFSCSIDWGHIKDRLNKERDKSVKWLRQALLE